MTKIMRNDRGWRMGEMHQNARLSSEEVENMRVDREELGLSYEKLAEKYGCGISTARDIVNYRTRTHG